MQAIAAELGFAETAFLHPAADAWPLRWFTPAKEVAPAPAPAALEKALGQAIVEHHTTSEDHLVVLRDEAAVRAVDPDMAALARLDPRAVIITAEGAHATSACA